MEKKQTAVDWIKVQIETPINDNKSLFEIIDDILNKAKEMEKEQIIDAFGYGHNEGCSYMYGGDSKSVTSEQYYNEIYGKETDRS